MAAATLITALVVIFIGAEAFTNALENLGQRLQISEGVTGSIFAAIATVSILAFKMLPSVYLDRKSCPRAKQINLHFPPAVKRNRQLDIQAELAGRFWQGFKSSKKKRFRGTPRTIDSFRISLQLPCHMNEQLRQRCINVIANEPSDTRGILVLPNGIDRQWNFDRPPRNGGSRQ